MSPLKLVALAIAFGFWFWTALVAACLADDWTGLVLNLATEIMGAGAIYLVLGQFIGSREKREAEAKALEAHKEDLIARMGINSRDVAVPAADELRRRGWLTDGSLQGANLEGADLQGAKLRGADLQGAFLRGADLQGASLLGADLQGADLWGANLQGASLGAADLQGAVLVDANLRGAFLWGAKLQWAVLVDANLQWADLVDARFDETTRLPDSTRWTPDTDMPRFTDPKHPEFWRSDDPESPAYRPEEQE